MPGPASVYLIFFRFISPLSDVTSPPSPGKPIKMTLTGEMGVSVPTLFYLQVQVYAHGGKC